MSNENAAVARQQRSPLIDKLAARFELTPESLLRTVQKQCFPKGEATTEQLVAFLIVVDQYGFNPFTKEIWAFPSSAGVNPVVSVDGWAKLINNHPDFNGMTFKDVVSDGKVVSITCQMHRKSRAYPVEVTEYLSECKRGTPMWNQWPARMLRHKATIQAARLAFGFSGILDSDEAERANDVRDDNAAAESMNRKSVSTLKERVRNVRKVLSAPTLTAEPATGEAEQVEPEYITEQVANAYDEAKGD